MGKSAPLKWIIPGKIVVLTGAAGGIGSRIAMLFAQNGASMLLVDKNEEMLRITREACGEPEKVLYEYGSGWGKEVFSKDRSEVQRGIPGLPMFSFIARQ